MSNPFFGGKKSSGFSNQLMQESMMSEMRQSDPRSRLGIPKGTMGFMGMMADTGQADTRDNMNFGQEPMNIKQDSYIDWDFIEELEGNETRGYVPKGEDGSVLGKSGVTIASGVDLGHRDYDSLIKIGIPEKLAIKLKPYLGLRGKDAAKVASGLELSKDETKLLNRAVKKSESARVIRMYEKDSGKKFNDLNTGQKTSVMSVGFQYGNLPNKTPDFWKGVTSGKWDDVLKELRNFGDKYKTRRNKEADYLDSFMNQTDTRDNMNFGQEPIK